MTNAPTPVCPDCSGVPRRDFLRAVGASAAALAVAAVFPPTSPLSPLSVARAARLKKQAEAESLVFELYKSMGADQRKKLVLPWDAGLTKTTPAARLGTHNAPVGKTIIGEEYDKKQGELLHKLFKSLCNGEEGYERLSRHKDFDASGAFENIGATIYGEPAEGKKFSLVFAGHHITLRCDGDSEANYAFGGPLYYGHTPNGYNAKNVFNYQTKIVGDVFESLTADQRKIGVLAGKWKDGVASVQLPAKDAKLPGIGYASLGKEQQELTRKVMKELVAPYRKEDGDEVMEIIAANGGFEKLSLAFYEEVKPTAKEPWTFWRLEGPGFVWSFRALPHVHTFVNINSKPG